MSHPHEILGLGRNASESEIRERYLELVRQFPPDRAPERFAAVHEAYEALRDPARRLYSQIFTIDTKDESIENIAADLLKRLSAARLPVDALLSLAEKR